MSKIVLIVEDDGDTREIYRTVLESRGYTVVEARDGAAGLEAAFHHRPDLILLDRYLPGLMGWDVCERLNSDARTAHIPILIASIESPDPERLSRIRCEAHVTKPYPPFRMVEDVERVIGPASGERPGPTAAD